MRVDRVVLENVSDPALLGRPVGDVHSVKQDTPALRLDEPADEAERGGLAAAGWPDNDNEFAVADGQIEALDSRHLAAIVDAEILDLEFHLIP